MEKRTRFVKIESPKADVIEQTQNLAPYTNTCSFSVKVGNTPEQKTLNGYQVVTFTGYHWQPKHKPQVPFTILIYDQDLQKQALELKQGQSLVVSGKLGYDVHSGLVKLFILVNTLHQ
jgi:hypothetical protein